MMLIIVKLISLFNAFLDYFVVGVVGVSFTAATDGGAGSQWLVHGGYIPSEKGTAVMDALATIIHYGLDFVAQFVSLMPLAVTT